MSDQAATLQILVDIRSRLDAIDATQRGLRGVAADTRDAARASNELRGSMQQLESMAKLGSVFAATGLTIQGVTQAVLGAITATSRLAGEIERAGGRLGLSAEGYQVLAATARAAGTEFTELLGGVQAYRQRLGEALSDPKAGAALTELKLNARQLAALPLERQMEMIAVALGGVDDDSRRAAIGAEIFGRGAAALRPVLESLRTDGFDKMRESVRETAGLLSNDAAKAIDDLGDRAEAANNRLGIALGTLNTKLLESKANIAEALADNGGLLGSGIEAAMEGALFFGVMKALQKLGGGSAASLGRASGSAIARGFSEGFGTGAAMLWRQVTRLFEGGGGAMAGTFANLGKMLATPFGAAFAVAVGATIIHELERVALERIAKENAANQAAADADKKRNASIKAIRTPEDRAAQLVSAESELIRLQQPNTERIVRTGGVTQRQPTFDAALLSDADRNRITDLQADIKALQNDALMTKVMVEGAAADAAAATAAQIASEAELWKQGGAYQVEATNLAKTAIDDDIKKRAARAEQELRFRAAEAERTKEAAKDEAEALRKRIEANIVRHQSIADVAAAERQAALSNPDLTAADRARIVAEQLEKQRDALLAIVVYRRQLAGLPGLDALEKANADAGVASAASAVDGLGAGSPPAKSHRERSLDSFQRSNRGEDENGTAALGLGDAVSTGAMDWVNSLGSAGEQVAGALQSSLGTTVQSITDGIYGWITGTEDFGDVLMNLGATVFQTMLQTIIQMGVQWLINAALIKMGMISIEATGDTLRAGRVVKENAAEAATLPAKTAGAAAAGISSWGLALIFGALAIAMIMGLAGGFATGGYTGPGGVYEPAGLVHRGEVVFSQGDVARSGGVAAVEAARLGGIPTISAVASAPAPITTSAPASPIDAGAAIAGAVVAAGAAAAMSRPSRTVVVDQRRIADQMRQEPGVTTFVQEIVSQMLPT